MDGVGYAGSDAAADDTEGFNEKSNGSGSSRNRKRNSPDGYVNGDARSNSRQRGQVDGRVASSGNNGSSVGWRTQRYSDRSFSLGQLIAEDLRKSYNPPLRAETVAFMAGCLVVRAQDLEAWAAAQLEPEG